jgi:hypothetical protein
MGKKVAAAKGKKDLANAEVEKLLPLCLLFLFHTGLIHTLLIQLRPKVDISALKETRR